MCKATLLFLLFNHFIFSADGGFSGIVYNESSEPLPGANVYLKDTNIGTSTDINGEFFIGNIQEGKYTLEIDFIGYKKVSKDYVISGEKNQFLEKLNLNDGQSDERTIERDFYLDLSFYLEPKSITSSQVDVKGHQLNQKLSDISKMAIFGPSRVRESYLSVGASVDRVSIRDIRISASLNFYEGLDYLKEVESKQVSALFTTLNVRGKGAVDVRAFTQLVDGVQANSIANGDATGNISGLSEIDVANIELLHGGASVLYGPYSTSGMILITSKTPWFYKGSSFQIKTGFNTKEGSPTTPFQHLAYRYGNSHDKFAYKIAISDKRATEWTTPKEKIYTRPSIDQEYSKYNLTNYTGDDIELNTIALFGGYIDNTITIPIARTGYLTSNLFTDKVHNTKINTSFRYKITDNTEITYDFKGGWGTFMRTQVTNLFNNGGGGYNHSINLTGSNWMTRLYTYNERNPFLNYKDIREYDLRELAIFLQEYSKPNDVWYQDYLAAYRGWYVDNNGDTLNLNHEYEPNNHDDARLYADSDATVGQDSSNYHARVEPNTSLFNELFEQYIISEQDDIWREGSNSFTNFEFIYDATDIFKYAGLQFGGNFRQYSLKAHRLISNTEDIVNQHGEIEPWEYALFAQSSKWLSNEKVKLQGALRIDFSDLFKTNISPSFSSVFKIKEDQFLRFSAQKGYLNPSSYWCYLNVGQTSFTAVGGSKSNLKRLGLENLRTNLVKFNLVAEEYIDQNGNGIWDEGEDFIDTNGNGLWNDVFTDTTHHFVSYPSAEELISYEFGYKGLLNKNIYIDVNYFYNHRTNMRDDGNWGFNPDEVQYIDIPGVYTGWDPGMYYYIFSHSKDNKETIHGASLSLSYNFDNGMIISGSYDYIDDIGVRNIVNIGAQNGYVGISRPKNRLKFSLKHPKLLNNIGYSLTGRYAEKYYFDSYLYHGVEEIKELLNLDAQISYILPKYNLLFKTGINNLLNRPYKATVNAQEIGSTYYLTLEYDVLIK